MSARPGPEPVPTRIPQRGHQLLAHTADWAFEAWGTSRPACFEEAVLALVECFADTSSAPAPTPIPVAFGPASDADLLVTLLEEVIYIADVLGVVPVTVELRDTDDGGLTGTLDAVAIDTVEAVGPAPKGVSHEIAIDRNGAAWTCRALIDV